MSAVSDSPAAAQPSLADHDVVKVDRRVAATRSGLARLRPTERRARSAAFRWVASRGRLGTSQPGVAAGALLARLGLLNAYAVWPGVSAPAFIVRPRDREVADYLRRTFEGGDHGKPFLDAATRNALRAGALVVPTAPSPVLRLASEVLDVPAARLRTGFVSIAGASVAKLICFVFEEGREEPAAVVKVMPERDQGARLRYETELVEDVRRSLGPTSKVARALPLAPLHAGEVAGDYSVVERFDPLGPLTGHDDRQLSLDWLAELQRGTQEGTDDWGPVDLGPAKHVVAYAWERADPDRREDAIGWLEALNQPLIGQAVPRCVVHGDFWRGNIAHGSEGMRVYDWEWARPWGRPFSDLWTYELAEVRERARMNAGTDSVRYLGLALSRVEMLFAGSGLDPAFARATLLPTIAELTFRIRRATGKPGGNEQGSVRVMRAALELLRA